MLDVDGLIARFGLPILALSVVALVLLFALASGPLVRCLAFLGRAFIRLFALALGALVRFLPFLLMAR